jgi:hypothetical protein
VGDPGREGLAVPVPGEARLHRREHLAGKTEALEGALWTALNTLEEGAQMSRRLAEESHGRGHEHAAARFEERARKTREQADLIRQALNSGAPDVTRNVV